MKRSIKLRQMGPNGEHHFVDLPKMGNLQPDWYSVYTVGYTNRPIPEFDAGFVKQFMDRAEELGIRAVFC
jgi:hypothetical protein